MGKRTLSVGMLVACVLAGSSHVRAGEPPAMTPATPTPAAAAIEVKPRDISADIAKIIEKHKIPGMAAVTVHHGRIVAQGVAGVRKTGSPELVTIDDEWHLGSCTKSMTATMCAMLVEKGKLRWDTTLAEVFPEFAPRMNEEFRGVTLQQLLTNRGGVPTDLNFDGLWGKLWHFKGTPTESRRFLMEAVTSRPPNYKPGTKNVYANASFAIAGHVAETVMGKPYEDLMQEMLFGPLGMTSCGWGAPGTTGKVDQPWGHTKDGKPVEPRPNTPDGRGADNPIAITPAGRLHCTIGDWAKYAALHAAMGRAIDGRPVLLTPETLRRLHTPPDSLSDYAYGWGRPERPWGGPKGDRFVITHSGSNTMWFCVLWIAPAKDFAVLVCCNTGIEAAGKACDEACAMMIGQELKGK
jgi:CubicO group peptidase (beta-lactamase class C family)